MATGLFFFDLYRSYLTIERNPSDNLPKSSSEIYSQVLGKMFKGSSWQDSILDGGDRRQLITFTVYKDSKSNDVKSNDSKSNDSKLIIKRKAILCKIQNSKPSEEDNLIFKTPEIQEFLNEGLKEYFISRLLSAHPAGINCYDFKITKLPKINYLVYEFMMEYGGISLDDYFNSYKPKDFNGLPFFIELINILKFIEKLGIAYSDVKMGNFLVDSQGHLRITDYDISQKADLLNSEKVTKISKLLGHTPGYVAPEAKIFITRQELGMLEPNEKINPWKADVYSCGMVGIVLFGVLLNPENIHLLDSFKKDEEKHNEFIANMANEIECKDNTLKEKIRFIISLCIDFNPTKRPNFTQLSTLLEKIEDSSQDLKELKKVWNKILKEEEEKNQKSYIQMQKKLELKDKEIEKMKTNEKELSDENLKLKNQLIVLNEINSNLKEEIKNAINLIKTKTEITNNSQNLNLYVNDVITYFQGKIKNDNELVEQEKSILLEECKKPLNEFKKELPKDLNDMPRIIRNLLNPLDPTPTKPKYENYEDAFKQMVNGNILTEYFANYIKSQKELEWWCFEKRNFHYEATKEEILNILELVKYSDKIKKLTFTNNTNFKEECERAYLDAIKANNSLVTIILYKTNVSKEVALEMLKILKIKPNIKVLVVEKEKIEEKVAKEFSNQMNLDTNKWDSSVKSHSK